MAKDDFDRRESDPLGRSFGPYRPIRRLGVGGMAETYEAIRTGPSGFSQRVCLKLVLPFFRDSDDFIELFEREARLAAKLRHSNIVGVIDFGSHRGTPYMALELVDGADLEALLERQEDKRLSPELVALVGHHIASALNHAHNPPPRSDPGNQLSAIIHRDISPSNVLISRHGEILLSDFGVAKAITGTTRKQSAVKGKVPYMSPEQLRAEPLDGRADLFALGVVLFESLSGQRPYLRENDPATILAILKGERPRLETLVPEAPEGLVQLIESLIEPDPEARPRTAAELIERLDEFVPSPRAQRDLGALVSAIRPPQSPSTDAAGMAFEATDASFDSERDETGIQIPEKSDGAQSGVTERDSATPAAVSPPSRKVTWAALLVLLLAAVGAGTFAVLRVPAPTSEPPSASEAAPVVQPAPDSQGSEPEVPTASAEDEGPPAASAEVANDAEATAPAPASARLSVVVYPWGRVWIDGKPRGLSPLNGVSLRPGRHRVSVGQSEPVKSEVVRLRAGQKRRLTFNLVE